jgi:hypothetical protein
VEKLPSKVKTQKAKSKNTTGYMILQNRYSNKKYRRQVQKVPHTGAKITAHPRVGIYYPTPSTK